MSPILKLGMFVEYNVENSQRDPRDNEAIIINSFPAIVYRIYPGHQYLGLYVFSDTGLQLMRNVVFSEDKKSGTWRYFPSEGSESHAINEG